MNPTCTRKDFIHMVAGTGVLTFLGCSSEPEVPGSGGAAGVGGASGSAGKAGSSGSGTGGAAGSPGASGSGGVSGSAGTGTTGGAAGSGAGRPAGGAGAGGASGAGGGSGAGASGSAGTGASGAPSGGRGGSAGSGPGGNSAGGRGGMGTGGMPGGNDCTGEITAVIFNNHGHALTIPLADITAAVTKVYSARGTAMHDHFVEVTAADFATLASGGIVKKHTCNGGDHEYVLSCATTTDMGDAPTCSDDCGSAMNVLCPAT
jgi:hypothetical protein